MLQSVEHAYRSLRATQRRTSGGFELHSPALPSGTCSNPSAQAHPSSVATAPGSHESIQKSSPVLKQWLESSLTVQPSLHLETLHHPSVYGPTGPTSTQVASRTAPATLESGFRIKNKGVSLFMLSDDGSQTGRVCLQKPSCRNWGYHRRRYGRSEVCQQIQRWQ